MLHSSRLLATGLLIGSVLVTEYGVPSLECSAAAQSIPASLGPPVTVSRAGAMGGAVFSPDGRLVATGSLVGVVRVWESATGRPVRKLNAGSRFAAPLAFLAAGNRLVTDDFAGSVKIWDVETGKTVATVTGDGLHSIGLTKSGLLWTLSGSASEGQDVVQAWNANTGALEVTLDDRVTGAMMAGEEVPVTFNGSEIRIRDPRTGVVVTALPQPPGRWPYVSLSRDRSLLALSVPKPMGEWLLSVRRVVDGTVIWETRVPARGGGAPVLQFAGDDNVLVEGGAQIPGDRRFTQIGPSWSNQPHILRLRNARDGSELGQPLVQVGSQMQMASLGPVQLFASGLIVASYAEQNGVGAIVSAWSLPGPVVRFRLPHTAPIIAFALSPDGSRLATTDEEGTLRIWQLPAGTLPASPPSPPAAVDRRPTVPAVPDTPKTKVSAPPAAVADQRPVAPGDSPFAGRWLIALIPPKGEARGPLPYLIIEISGGGNRLTARTLDIVEEDFAVKDPQVSVKDGQLVLVVDVPRTKLTLRGRRTGDRLEGTAESTDEPEVVGFVGVATTDEKVADAVVRAMTPTWRAGDSYTSSTGSLSLTVPSPCDSRSSTYDVIDGSQAGAVVREDVMFLIADVGEKYRAGIRPITGAMRKRINAPQGNLPPAALGSLGLLIHNEGQEEPTGQWKQQPPEKLDTKWGPAAMVVHQVERRPLGVDSRNEPDKAALPRRPGFVVVVAAARGDEIWYATGQAEMSDGRGGTDCVKKSVIAMFNSMRTSRDQR